MKINKEVFLFTGLIVLIYIGVLIASYYNAFYGFLTNESNLDLNISDENAIDCGYNHIVGLKSDGSVEAIGNNEYHQCEVDKWTDIVSVSAGYGHTAALNIDRKVLAAGNNSFGQCNVDKWDDIVSVSAGAYHTLGLKSDGSVVSAGENLMEQCNVNKWERIVYISAGLGHSLGVDDTGRVHAAGIDTCGQCDVGTWENIAAVSAGDYHSVGLRTDGTLVAVGNNDYGQCDVQNYTNVVEVDCGDFYTLIKTNDGNITKIGYDSFDITEDFFGASQMSAGEFNCAIINTYGMTYIAGNNDYGILNAANTSQAVDFDVNKYHTVFLNEDGTVTAMGSNDYGQCDVSHFKDIVQISAGEKITVGIDSNGNVYGTKNMKIDYMDEDTFIGEIDNARYIFMGSRGAAIVLDDGTVRVTSDLNEPCHTWNNIVKAEAAYYKIVVLSDTGEVYVSHPTIGYNILDCTTRCLNKVADMEKIVDIAVSKDYVLGLRDDGKVLYCEINNVDNTTKTLPWENIVDISMCFSGLVGLKSDGTVVSNGKGKYEEKALSELKDIVDIETSQNHTVAKRSDGSYVQVINKENFYCSNMFWNDMRVYYE